MATTGKRGRPTKDEAQKANLRVSFDLTPDEYLQFESFFSEYRKQHPKKKSVTKKAFFLSSIRNVSAVSQVESERVELMKDLAKFRSDFAHIGANINQVAHLVNSIGYAHSESDLAQRLAEMNAHLSKVDASSDILLDLMDRLIR